MLDRGQRDVHDGHVEHDHQHAHAQHVQRHPALVQGAATRVPLLWSALMFRPPLSRDGSASDPASRPCRARRAAGVSSPSRNTPCSVIVSFVPLVHRLQLDGRDRHGDARVVQVHLIRVHEPLALDDVLEARDELVKAPTGDCTVMRSRPPTRKSSSCSGFAGACGPNQRRFSAGSAHVCHTRAGAAS